MTEPLEWRCQKLRSRSSASGRAGCLDQQPAALQAAAGLAAALKADPSASLAQS